MPVRAAKLFQLLDFCEGGAVLRKRRVGAAARGRARNAFGRAIDRKTGRNMLKRDKEMALGGGDVVMVSGELSKA
jgi:hypothetical protein